MLQALDYGTRKARYEGTPPEVKIVEEQDRTVEVRDGLEKFLNFMGPAIGEKWGIVSLTWMNTYREEVIRSGSIRKLLQNAGKGDNLDILKERELTQEEIKERVEELKRRFEAGFVFGATLGLFPKEGTFLEYNGTRIDYQNLRWESDGRFEMRGIDTECVENLGAEVTGCFGLRVEAYDCPRKRATGVVTIRGREGYLKAQKLFDEEELTEDRDFLKTTSRFRKFARWITGE